MASWAKLWIHLSKKKFIQIGEANEINYLTP